EGRGQEGQPRGSPRGRRVAHGEAGEPGVVAQHHALAGAPAAAAALAAYRPCHVRWGVRGHARHRRRRCRRSSRRFQAVCHRRKK
ncbi:Os03g0243950, partial [Oryza sativa Japonica Group]